MKKALVLLCILLVCAGIGGGLYITVLTQSKPQIQTTLSDRAKLFLKDQSASQAAELHDVKLANGKSVDISKQAFIKPGCFSLIIPFAIDSERKDAMCTFYIRLSRPIGFISMSYQDTGSKQTAEASGVTFRRENKEYIEETISTKNNQFIVFHKKEGNYEKTAFHVADGKLLTVTLSGGGDADANDKGFKTMLETLDLE